MISAIWNGAPKRFELLTPRFVVRRALKSVGACRDSKPGVRLWRATLEIVAIGRTKARGHVRYGTHGPINPITRDSTSILNR
jgi:hypothetical protein